MATARLCRPVPRLRSGLRRCGASHTPRVLASTASTASSIKSVFSTAVNEVFAIDLLGTGGLTEMTLTRAPGKILLAVTVARPLGMVLEQRTAGCVVAELVDGGNASVAGVAVGDILRLCTAVLETRGKVDTFAFYSVRFIRCFRERMATHAFSC